MQMLSFEEVCQKIFRDDRFVLKMVIGGALGFVPLLHFLVFGYFVTFARNIRENGLLRLPDWRKELKHWERLALDGIVFFVVFAVVFIGVFIAGLGMYYLQRLAMPVFSGFGFFSFYQTMMRSAFNFLVYLPYAVALLVTPAIAVAALNVYLRTNNFNDYLRLDLIFRLLRYGWPRLVVPSFAFMGFMLLGTPLLSFAFLLGFTPILAYTTVVFLILENEHDDA
jgi:hypothetical protein